MLHFLRVTLMAAFAAIGTFGWAQEVRAPRVAPSPIMIVDFERVFSESLYGQRITADLNAERERVQAENDRLAEELLAEESALTEARGAMDPEAFREAATAFDERAQSVRASREAEQDRLVTLRDNERARFVERIQPLMSEMMIERGAVVTMDRRAVIEALDTANATEEAIEVINAVLGDGRRDPADSPPLRPQRPADNNAAEPGLSDED